MHPCLLLLFQHTTDYSNTDTTCEQKALRPVRPKPNPNRPMSLQACVWFICMSVSTCTEEGREKGKSALGTCLLSQPHRTEGGKTQPTNKIKQNKNNTANKIQQHFKFLKTSTIFTTPTPTQLYGVSKTNSPTCMLHATVSRLRFWRIDVCTNNLNREVSVRLPRGKYI